MSARPKFYIDIEEAVAITYPPTYRDVPTATDSLERDRYEEAIREWKESRYDHEERDE